MWYNSGVNHLPDNSLNYCPPLSPITITYYGHYVTKQISAWHTSFKEQKWYFFLICDVLLLHDHLSPTLFWGQVGLLRRAMGQLCGPYYKELNVSPILLLRDLSEISRGGGGGNRGGVTTFWALEKGGAMKNGPLSGGGSCKYMPVIM